MDPSVITFGYSTRSAGNMSFTCGEPGAGKNRSDFLSGLGLDFRQMVLPRQVHGSRIETVAKKHRGAGAESAETGLADTDALLTRERGLPIGIMTADCLPVLIFDPLIPSVAVVHAGWKSTRERIAAKTVERLRAEFGSDPGKMCCFLGPSIRRCCYEVREDIAAIFPRSVQRIHGGLRLDLAAENVRQLAEAGVMAENIRDSGHCTCCRNDMFFSYRREGASCGRMLSVMMLR